MSDDKKGLVLLVHGSRDPGWMVPFAELRDRVASKAPGARVIIACMQFGAPTVEEALSGLAREGIREIVVAPVFISALGHVRKDVPGQVEKARKKFPELKVTISPAVGELPEVQAALRDVLVRLAGK